MTEGPSLWTDPPEERSGSAFFPGEIIGPCVLQRVLRTRKMREVWLVFDRERQCHAVLKFLSGTHPRLEILRELARFLAGSECPQLIRVQEILPVNGWLAIELEYAAGGSLGALLKTEKRLPLDQSVFVMREILSALAELHRHGIVHRDLKPGNVWITDRGGIRVGDLGIARLKTFREPGPAVFGSSGAMSPEQTVDTTKADHRSDFYSLASMMFELLTGKKRFPRGNLVETARLIRKAKPEEMRPFLQEFAPPGLVRLLMWMAAQNRAERPPDAKTILDELDRLRLPCARSMQSKTAEEQLPPQG